MADMRNIRGDKLYVQVFQEIRTFIAANNLKPGDVLPSELEMCRMLGVSRNVLREALKALDLMGILRAQPGRGYIVQEFDLTFLFQNVLYFLAVGDNRASLEALDIRKRLELSYMSEAYDAMDERDVRHIRASLEEIKANWERHIFFHADDREFHMALFRPLQNHTLDALMSSIWHVDEYFKKEEKLQYMGSTVEIHESIADALERRDKQAFLDAMQRHFSSEKYAKNGGFQA